MYNLDFGFLCLKPNSHIQSSIFKVLMFLNKNGLHHCTLCDGAVLAVGGEVDKMQAKT